MIRHHPSAEILADYARGALAGGPALVVACHVSGCTVCRSEAGLWESAGGAMLEVADPVALNEGALAKALARLHVEDVPAMPRRPGFMHRYGVPVPLGRHRIGTRRWVTPNIWFAPVDSLDLTYLVFARRNTKLSRHTHGGHEFTHVLDGAFADSTGRFDIGDFAQTDETVEHAPKATAEGACLCLISSEMPMCLKHTPARLLQSLFGMQY
jgi:putative transcriptional regulator